ncbi:MAG: VWA domain-containing protein [Gammaproteobacteria bacterium]|nr:VWA domain-containing protein [Gammaproteobacteria bacterium]
MFVFSAPWILLFLPLPLLSWFILPPIKIDADSALRAPFLYHMKDLLKAHSFTLRGHIRQYSLAALIWLLLVGAAAGPQWLGSPLAFPREGRNIMMAVDISGSMQIPDMSVNGQELSRLAAVQLIAKQFIEKRKGDRLGLILFGSKAYLQTPLTFDRDAVLYNLEDSSIGLAGQLTALGDGIALAVKHLKDLPENNRVLILLTDGASNSGQFSPLDAANLAAKYQIKIYTIGFGSDNLMVPGSFGLQAVNPSADLDENTLQAIAAETGGHYFRAKNMDSLNQVYNQINQLEPVQQDKVQYRPQKALYPWPLCLAFLIAFALLLKRTLPSLKAMMVRTPGDR